MMKTPPLVYTVRVRKTWNRPGLEVLGREPVVFDCSNLVALWIDELKLSGGEWGAYIVVKSQCARLWCC